MDFLVVSKKTTTKADHSSRQSVVVRSLLGINIPGAVNDDDDKDGATKRTLGLLVCDVSLWCFVFRLSFLPLLCLVVGVVVVGSILLLV